MKESLIVLLFFGAGVLAGVMGDFPSAFVGIVHEAKIGRAHV